ncbi:hypothetical protein [Williamsia sp. 1135]|uniref:hypothetical protein n=1 Tax=Williamsia sp. 1135 TaxID=1889262 RepID=UPI00117BFE6F|nr:hypothetical protein [Williamsia sp. 1135]
MSARQPVVGGVGGGVGTSLIAALIGARDAGVVDDQSDPVDVLVCRSVSSDLAAATRLAAVFMPHPVVVINADCGDKPPAQVRDRARMMEPNVPAVLWFPWVKELRALATPIEAIRHDVVAEVPPAWVMRARSCREALVTAVLPLVTTDQPVDEPAPRESASTTEASAGERLRRIS